MPVRFTNKELWEMMKQSGHTFTDCKNLLKILTDFILSELNIFFNPGNEWMVQVETKLKTFLSPVNDKFCKYTKNYGFL